MAATRYALMMLRFASTKAAYSNFRRPHEISKRRNCLMRVFVDRVQTEYGDGEWMIDGDGKWKLAHGKNTKRHIGNLRYPPQTILRPQRETLSGVTRGPLPIKNEPAPESLARILILELAGAPWPQLLEGLAEGRNREVLMRSKAGAGSKMGPLSSPRERGPDLQTPRHPPSPEGRGHLSYSDLKRPGDHKALPLRIFHSLVAAEPHSLSRTATLLAP